MLRSLVYADGDVRLVGQLAVPEGAGPFPAVLVAHEIDGLGPHVRLRAEMLAQIGYVALAADNYGDGGLYEGDEARAHMDALMADPDVLRRRMQAGLDALAALPEVDPTRLAAIGYCFGGLCVLELARSGADLAGVVSFHGILSTRLPAEPGAVRARILVAHGDKDPLVPRAQVTAFEDEMDAAGADWQLIAYGNARHAFTNPNVVGRENDVLAYDPSADRQSWAAMLAFFGDCGLS